MVETLLISNDLQSYWLTHLMVKTLMSVSVCVCVCVRGGGKDREIMIKSIASFGI